MSGFIARAAVVLTVILVLYGVAYATRNRCDYGASGNGNMTWCKQQ